jgi:ABC-type transporter Mla subunit MlaD
VGSVKSLRVTRRHTAEATLDLQDAALGLGADASAAIRPANLLGEKFVDLTVGDRSKPLRTDRIELAHTSTPVELDDVIDVLDPTTSARLGLLVSELGIGLQDRGRDLAGALKGMHGTVHNATQLFNEVTADTRVLERLLGEADRVSAAIARQRRPLGALVHTGAEAFAELGARRTQLAGTVHAAPGTLAQLRGTLQRLDRAGAALRPAARGLRATAVPLRETLRALPGFDAAATPALATATRIAPSLTQLGLRAAPVVRRLRPTAASLRGLATDSDTLTATLDGSAANVLSVMENWAHAIQGRDAVGHLFRVSLSLTPDLLRQLDAYVQGAPSRQASRRGPKPHVDAVPQPLQDTVRRVVDGAAGGPGGGAATQGLKPLLDYLLGR